MNDFIVFAEEISKSGKRISKLHLTIVQNCTKIVPYVFYFSPSCNADDYGQMGWPLCSPEEQVAVRCYDDMWKVDVGFKMVKKNGKMSCPVQVFKMIFR